MLLAIIYLEWQQTQGIITRNSDIGFQFVKMLSLYKYITNEQLSIVIIDL